MSLTDKPIGYKDPSASLTRAKYDSSPDLTLTLYGFVNFGLVLLQTAVVMLTAKDIPYSLAIPYAVYICFAIWSISLMFDCREKQASLTELLRIIAAHIMTISIVTNTQERIPDISTLLRS